MSALVGLSVAKDVGGWLFPMFDATRQIIGVRRRLRSGTKRCVTGSRNGLFLPSHEPGAETVFVAEGESDSAALLTLGLYAVGLPGAGQASRCLTRFTRGRKNPIVVVADNDDVGSHAAQQLAKLLALYSPSVKVIHPPSPSKDAREWVQRGATAEKIRLAAAQARSVHVELDL